MRTKDLFESESRIIKLRGFKEPSETPAMRFMRDFDAITIEHPFTTGMRYFENGPVLVNLHASKFSSEIQLQDIQSKAAGAGAEAMKAICALADKHHVEISLYAKGYDRVPTEKLVEYYKRFGFEIVRDGDEGVDMERRPQ